MCHIILMQEQTQYIKTKQNEVRNKRMNELRRLGSLTSSSFSSPHTNPKNVHKKETCLNKGIHHELLSSALVTIIIL